MNRFIAALAEGEITTDEFTVLAWIGIMGEWHGKTEELHAALRWPHGPKHLAGVLRGLREYGLIEYTARERSRAPFDLCLAAPVAPGETPCTQDVSLRKTGVPPRHNNEHCSMPLPREATFNTHSSSIDTGTHHSSLSGSQGSEVAGGVASQPSRTGTPEEAGPEDWDDLKEAVRAAYEAEPEPDPVLAKVLARFGEPEPAAVTDTEAHRRRR
jgi:hypothetical protein